MTAPTAWTVAVADTGAIAQSTQANVVTATKSPAP
jgi:hypothetical protein